MNTFKICYLSSEVAPFAGDSELANTAYALPAALKEMNQDIRLMMPKYKSINERRYVLREVIRLREVTVELAGETKFANGKTAFLPNSKVHVYFLSIPEYFDRKGVYTDPQSGKNFPDNAQRFAHFAISVMETLKLLYWQPDIIHCNNWATALIPYYLKVRYKDDDFFRNTSTVLTIHDFANQGIFPMKIAPEIGIEEEFLQPGGAFEFEGKINFLKGGILFADKLNTTSIQTMEDVLTNPDKAHGLADIINRRKKDFQGIVNGLNYGTWNPETDEDIATPYDAKSVTKKQENKKAFCSEMELDPSRLLIKTLVDINEKQQLEIFSKVVADLAKDPVQLFLFADESSPYFSQLEKLAKKHAQFVTLRSRLDTRLSHLLWAAADMLFLPFPDTSSITPLLKALRYGTVPVALYHGVIRDVLVPFDGETGKGSGFAIPEATPPAMLSTLRKAFSVQKDGKMWAKIQKSGMRSDFSWETTAKKYLKLYEKAAKKKR